MSQRNASRFTALSSLLALVLLLASGCSKDKTTNVDTSDCARLMSEAQTSLETALYTEINSTPSRPADVNFSVPSSKFNQALAGCPSGDPTANFGAAFANLMSLTQDTEVNAAFDEWTAYINANRTPFHTSALHSRPFGIPLSLSGGADALRLPFQIVPRSLLAPMRAVGVTTDPQIGRVQDILSQRVLPALNTVIQRLGYVASDPAFTYTVTPRMRGDESATPREIDHTDVLAVRAAAELLAATCHAAVAYQLNFAAYDSANLVAALTPGSGWLALKNDGASHMALARTDMLSAIDDLDLSVTSLLAETDDQSNDVIKFDNQGFGRAQAESLHVYLQRARTSVATGFTMTADWDGSDVTPDVPLQVRIGQLFTNPVPDWKQMFPAYTVSTERRPLDYQYQSDFGQAPVNITVATAGTYSGYVDCYSSGNALVFYYTSGDPEVTSLATALLIAKFAEAQARPGYVADSYSGYVSFYATLAAGINAASLSWSEYYATATTSVFVPVITWNADDFGSWIWPHPSLQGVLPDITTTTQLETTFGITADSWQKRNVLDWTGRRGYYLKHRGAPPLQARVARR